MDHQEDIDIMVGHIGDRNEETGEWQTFVFEVFDSEGQQHSITISESDLADLEWMQLFDWLEDWADEYDIDYENKYGET